MKNTKGFTLIELLVVIAIIGILSSIVLVSLGSARSKGEDAKTASNLANMRAGAELWYSDHNTAYTGFCASATGSLAGLTGSDCNESATEWAAAATLKKTATGGGAVYHCVDSTGVSKETTTALAETATVCTIVAPN